MPPAQCAPRNVLHGLAPSRPRDAGTVLLLNNAGPGARLTPRLADHLRAAAHSAGARLAIVDLHDDAAVRRLAVADVRAVVASGSSVVPLSDIVEGGPATAWNAATLCRFPVADVLGVCYGMQALASMHGGAVAERADGRLRQDVVEVMPRHAGAAAAERMYVAHRHYVARPPVGFAVTHADADGQAMAMEFGGAGRRRVVGVQFHPEAPESQPAGGELIRRFVHAALARARQRDGGR